VDAATIKRLNEINREFYRTMAQNFDDLRGRFWPGWKRLLPWLADLPDSLSACGEGAGVRSTSVRFPCWTWAAAMRASGAFWRNTWVGR
jgi:hypothetical protein